LDIAEHEAKILVWLGDNWQPPAKVETVVESILPNETNDTCPNQQSHATDIPTDAFDSSPIPS
jgi:hypothetical protein